MIARRPAAIGLLLFAGGLAAVIVLTTPWTLIAHVPGGRVQPSAARDFTAAQIARADTYRSTVHVPSYLALGLGLLAAIGLGLTPVGGRVIDRLARPFGRGWAWRVLVGGLLTPLVVRLVQAPFDAWAQSIEHHYGLTTQSWAGWGADQARGLAVTVVPTWVALFAFFALSRRLPRHWWLPAAGGAAGLVLLGSFLYPVAVEPVFNSFHPLPAGPLRHSLVQLAHRDGVRVSDVLVADASRRTTTLNAYVSGFGATKRIVVYDTLLRDSTPAEVRLIVAHELGHAKNDDVLHGTFEGALAVAAGVCLLALVVSAAPVRRRAGVASVADPRSTSLLLALVAVATFLAGPVQNLVSRQIEARADLHALDLTHDVDTYVAAQEKLATAGLSDLDPSPVVYYLFASHPTAPERIAMARDWARAHPGLVNR